MSFRLFVEEASSLVSEACRLLGYTPPPKLEWDFPPSKDLGDASFRVGYQIAKIARKRPAEIVAELSGKIERDLSGSKKYVKSAEGHPSGFLNFHYDEATFFTDILREAKQPRFGSIDLGMGQSVLVEHTSVNPNKALHIGHARNVVLGDSIARILRFTNHDVKVLNYIDDSGLQVADVLVGILYLGFPKEPEDAVTDSSALNESPVADNNFTSPSNLSLSKKKFDHYAGDEIYVKVNKNYESDPSLREKQKLVLKAIEEHDEEIFPLALEITDRILKEQVKTCWQLGASYDLFVYESDIIESKLWQDVFSELKSKEIAKLESEGKLKGCWIVTIEGEKEGEDKVLVRSDGTATYVAKDIPFAALKIGLVSDKFTYSKYVMEPDDHQVWRSKALDSGEVKQSPVHWGAKKSITVIDARQARLQRVIRHILEKLSGENLSERYLHLGYSIVSLSPRTAASLSIKSAAAPSAGEVAGEGEGEGIAEKEQEGVVTMSGRKGTYINADDVLASLKEAALRETRKRNPDTSDAAWFDQVSENIARSAIRFSLLKQDLDKMIIFDMEDSLKLVGETGPYMLYTYARASSILSKVGDALQPSNHPIRGELLSSETERDLVSTLSKFDLSVEKAVVMLAPKWIAHYSFELCESFNRFYEKHRVLQVEARDLREARIELVRSFQNVLKQALGLLGIECLQKI